MSDGDIEFLDEDADIVQQCVHSVDPISNFNEETELLIERMPHELKSNKRKRKIVQDDTDYDPSKDIRRNRKRKQGTQNISNQTQNLLIPRQNISRQEQNTPRQTERFQLAKVKNEPVQAQTTELDLKERRNINISIPDYDDPLCLPVKAVMKDKDDAHKLKSWNNLCLEKLKQSDKPMRVEKDETVKSKRTVILRNMRGNQGKIESTIYSVIVVENKAGTKKTELIQSVLPKYRERNVLHNFRLYKKPRTSLYHHKTEVLLTQEISNDEEKLVVYNPQESLSLEYKMFDKESDPDMRDEDSKKYLKEVSCSKMCASCYQDSFKSQDQNIYCYICKKACASAHGLVTHLKSHSRAEIRKYKNVMSEDLSGAATHQHQCRICQNKFMSNKSLRKHVVTHKGAGDAECFRHPGMLMSRLYSPDKSEHGLPARLSRDTFNYIHELIQEDLVRTFRGYPTIPSHHQLMIALWKMATMDSYRSVSNRFNVGQGTAVRATRRVCHALFKRTSRFIQWPREDRAINVMREFEKASGFPKVIGTIDGTHIRINAPQYNSVDYINRRRLHSIQLQLVCDHKTLITHCSAGHPGSVDVQKVFSLSEVADYLNDDDKFPENSHILGDSAYEIHQHLLTPYRDNGHLSEKKKRYNDRHSTARGSVERCIGLLKGRMRSLSHCLPMTRVDLMAEYIVACCVIHNICILQEDEFIVQPILQSNQEKNEKHSREVSRNAGTIKRDVIMNSL